MLEALAKKSVSTKVTNRPTPEQVLGSAGVTAEPPQLDELTGELRTVGGANTLSIFGWGGGYGPNGAPFTSTSPDFQYNMARLAFDVAGAGAVLRMNCTAPYSLKTDKWSSWNFPIIDAAVAIADHVGCQILLSVNVRSPTNTDCVPKITSGEMVSWKAQWPLILGRYCGPSATIKAGSTVTVAWKGGGSTGYTISGAWPGILYLEVWNEPNSIGTCGGALNSIGSQGHAWYDVVYILNRGALEACQAHSSWGSFKLSAVTMGGLHTDYLIGTPTSPGVLRFGASQGFDWYQNGNGFHAVSMHCYMKKDPLVSGVDAGGTGSATGSAGELDTIRTAIRPGMNSQNAAGCFIWITEGGHGGTLSPSTGLEQWNQYNPLGAGGHDPAGTQNKSTDTGDCSWGHYFGDPGMNVNQLSGHLSHPMVMRNYVRKLRNMNQTGAGVEMMVWHMLIRPVHLEGHFADFPTGINGWSYNSTLIVDDASQGGEGNLYWQLARCLAELVGADTNRNLYTQVSAASGTATLTIASPAVAGQTGHGLTAGKAVRFLTTGALPTGVAAHATYYVLASGLTANTFQFSATPGGAAINTSGSQSGTHSLAGGSPDWLPAASHLHDEIMGGAVLSAPVFTTPPSLSTTTPAVGDTVTCNPGVCSGNPTPNFSYLWYVNNVAQAAQSPPNQIPVTSGDLGFPIKCKVTATNNQGSANSTTPNSSNVTNQGGGVPQNTTPPSLSDAQGLIGGSNAPNQGAQLTLDHGVWNPPASGGTPYQYAWEKTTDGGATWTTL